MSVASSAITTNSSPPLRATKSVSRVGRLQPVGDLAQDDVAGPVAERVVHQP